MLNDVTADPAISVSGLTKRYGTRTLFEDVSTTIPAGLTAVMGPSGAGKTTFLLVVAGLEPPTAGQVDRPVTSREVPSFTWIMQSANLLPARSALENVALPAIAAGERADRAHRQARAALARVGLAPMAERLAGGLSGGERQRVAVARALTSPASLVLADEPTASLGPDHRGVVVDALLAVAETERVVLVATHDPVVAEACDRVIDLGRDRGPS